jgi:hypothetical protein
MQCRWHPDIDALSFQPEQHLGRCFIHRRAFQTLLGAPSSIEDCQNYFIAHVVAFQVAAAAKVARDRLEPAANFHLNSRDIKRALAPIG